MIPSTSRKCQTHRPKARRGVRACSLRCATRQLTSLLRDVMAPGSSASSSFPCRHGESSFGRRSSLSSASAPQVRACLPACLCPQRAPPSGAAPSCLSPSRSHPPHYLLLFFPLPPSLPPSPSLPLTTTSLRAGIPARARAHPRRVTLPVICNMGLQPRWTCEQLCRPRLRKSVSA